MMIDCPCPSASHDYNNDACPLNQVKYRALIRTDKQTLLLLSSAVSEAEANEQIADFMRFMSQFPGGTQAVAGWIEPTL